jgi:hypothetical protein
VKLKGAPPPPSLAAAWENKPARLPPSLYLQLLLIQRLAASGYKSWFFESPSRLWAPIFGSLPRHEQNTNTFSEQMEKLIGTSNRVPLRTQLGLSVPVDQEPPAVQQAFEYWEGIRWLNNTYHLNIVFRNSHENNFYQWFEKTKGKKVVVSEVPHRLYSLGDPNTALTIDHHLALASEPEPFQWQEAILHAIYLLRKWNYVPKTRSVAVPISSNTELRDIIETYESTPPKNSAIRTHDYWIVTNDETDHGEPSESAPWSVPSDFSNPSPVSPFMPVMTCWSVLFCIGFGPRLLHAILNWKTSGHFEPAAPTSFLRMPAHRARTVGPRTTTAPTDLEKIADKFAGLVKARLGSKNRWNENTMFNARIQKLFAEPLEAAGVGRTRQTVRPARVVLSGELVATIEAALHAHLSSAQYEQARPFIAATLANAFGGPAKTAGTATRFSPRLDRPVYIQHAEALRATGNAFFRRFNAAYDVLRQA